MLVEAQEGISNRQTAAPASHADEHTTGYEALY